MSLTSDTIKTILADANARYFDIEEETNLPEEMCAGFLLSTRDNGDVGEEEAGEEDKAAGRRILKVVKEKHPELKTEYEVVDEWVHVRILKPAPVDPNPVNRAEELADKTKEILIEILTGKGFLFTGKTRSDGKDRAYCNIESETTLLRYKNNSEAGRAGFVINTTNRGELKIGAYGSSSSQVTTRIEHPTKTGPAAEADVQQEETEIRGKINYLFQNMEKEGLEMLKTPWESIPYSKEDPAGQLLGHSGWEGPWENQPYIRLAENPEVVQYNDHENGTSYTFPHNRMQEIVQMLGEFYPVIPEDAISSYSLTEKLFKELRAKIEKEALSGQTTTLEQLGVTATPHIAACDLVYFIPKVETPQTT